MEILIGAVPVDDEVIDDRARGQCREPRFQVIRRKAGQICERESGLERPKLLVGDFSEGLVALARAADDEYLSNVWLQLGGQGKRPGQVQWRDHPSGISRPGDLAISEVHYRCLAEQGL